MKQSSNFQNHLWIELVCKNVESIHSKMKCNVMLKWLINNSRRFKVESIVQDRKLKDN
jgi:hypothetical protein